MKLMNGIAAVFAVAVLVTIAVSASGAFSGATGSAGSARVESGPVTIGIRDLAFRNGTRTVVAGTTVTWRNSDGTTHTVTATDKSFASGDLAGGRTYAHRFPSIGRFPYYCSIHPFMKGVVSVVAPYGKS